ncbi:type II toxin-antitoxin system PemK/MazF family toxin [Xenorhabdus nematophila]|uniref:type II toxin-antitoxin system PemK/MazF family toxin n=1 Tax=Xenorhabdus nematophila TaxID=628 RepID=UPI0005443AE3|nr:type II toxin-antitoxin system PemK/MazF family toxin [Xenorhabdus nematophila]CEF31560.1 mRNA interferase MazF protein (toxin-antitoxin system) [Xenorhabdus nematophila str. Websteri]AYA41334.1 type II toxin-antitoxin system PemK/MazF family toxin [Xenorhabdus nematophila]KHD29803.1 PemK family transcriptional regulator [Xenorhabdus nematophila]MBA0020071.1 type II toxin-antitoxin system PemK/MazF family toxin [Xenorhabdus nematophila]MCB4423815.1 type II toxin-antitoxin system PemK/MazF f
MYIPDKGDIISLNSDPSAGKEIMKRRPAFVISRKMFNEHTGFAVVVPITSTARGMKLEVILPEEVSVQGSILIHQVKSLDFSERQVKFIEKAPQYIIDRVTELTKAIIL